MTRGIKYSRKAAVAAIATVAIATGTLALRIGIKGWLAKRVSAADQEERGASLALSALSEFDEAHLKALRESTARFRLRLGENSTWEKARAALDSRWTHEGGATTEHGAYSTEIHRIHLAKPATADWPRIVDAVALLEKSPGIQVEGLEMRSSGSLVQRSLDLVRMTIVVQLRKGTAQIPTR